MCSPIEEENLQSGVFLIVIGQPYGYRLPIEGRTEQGGEKERRKLNHLGIIIMILVLVTLKSIHEKEHFHACDSMI